MAPKQIYKFFSPYFIITLQAAGLLFGSDCTRTRMLVSSIELQHTKGAEMNGNGSRERFGVFRSVNRRKMTAEHMKCWRCGLTNMFCVLSVCL